MKGSLEKQYPLSMPFPRYSVLSLGNGGALEQSNVSDVRKSRGGPVLLSPTWTVAVSPTPYGNPVLACLNSNSINTYMEAVLFVCLFFREQVSQEVKPSSSSPAVIDEEVMRLSEHPFPRNLSRAWWFRKNTEQESLPPLRWLFSRAFELPWLQVSHL